MSTLTATNITSPLGMTTQSNYAAVKSGRTALAWHDAGSRGVPFGFCASLFTEEQWAAMMLPGLSRFESIVVRSVRQALAEAEAAGRPVDVQSPRTLLIVSTTKGDIMTSPGVTAGRIAQTLGVTTMPIVVCCACISGVAAQTLAMRLTDMGECDTAIVTGGDVQSEFIISGFQSLKALSPEPCRPFDAERMGLNLGEAAATMIYTAAHTAGQWRLAAGAIRNDAYHISGPHPKGDGCLLTLQQVAGDRERLAAIGVHGTATMYNDQMESKAIERAGLSDIPVSALKGYYGHTMGAAGLLETIITATALDEGLVLPSMGYAERGVSGRVGISPTAVHTARREFIKMLSGFGGCNGAIRMTKGAPTPPPSRPRYRTVATYTARDLSPEALTAEYRSTGSAYPRFHKMDPLSKLAYLGAETLLRDVQDTGSSTAVILFNSQSSLAADSLYMDSIADKADYYPSPSAFVHTLPNISTGEVALRHAMHGETAFYILPRHDSATMERILTASLLDPQTEYILTGWLDTGEMRMVERISY
ncbi:MAG: beta-ketoacyl synthase N-terminal-like domain-containing protein [Prevotellaceae bacterium]|nr:beta-ketoacyl synthase N-terminal-like domain-containing protein [Prevotellaceae bacterium]MDO4932821.1 beta-ketoacyl synthase N-terminal-like domain-containing protein [Prevotellaceae bacterium]